MRTNRQSATRWSTTVFRLLVGVGVALLVAQPTTASQSEASRKALEKAAERGSAPAQYALGAGAEAAGDYPTAVVWFTQAAEQGYAAAHFRLGQMYEEGKGVERDLAKAGEWYRSAAALGSSEAASRLHDLQAPSELAPASASPAVTSEEAATVGTPPTQQLPSDAVALTQNSLPAYPQYASPQPPAAAASAPTPEQSPDARRATESTDGSPENATSSAGGLATTVLRGLLTGVTGVLFVILWAGLTRPAVMKWYRSGAWFIQGDGASDILRSHIRLRMQVEFLGMFFALLPCGLLYWLGLTMLGLA